MEKKKRSWMHVLCLAFLSLACACSSDEKSEVGENSDAGISSDASQQSCALASAQISQPAELESSRCGVAGDWIISSEELGQVVTTGDTGAESQTAAALGAIAQLAGISAPRDPAYDVSSDTILYTTQDRGELIEASALVAYPTNYQGQVPVLLFLHGTSGFSDGCGVSTDTESALLAQYIASLGYAVVAPDYIGLKAFGDATGFLHPYLVGEATAIASLDSVRALHNYVQDESSEVCLSSDLALLGGSQGGHAALWVDRLAPYYAGEMNLVGGVATVPPADLVAQMQRALQSQVPATGNSIAFLGTLMDWYGLEGRSDEIFVPRTPSISELLGGQCNPGDTVGGLQLEDVFSAEILDIADEEGLAEHGVWGCVTRENSLNYTSISRQASGQNYGLLYVVGEEDTLVHPPIQRESFDELCEQGVPLNYLECSGASHGAATLWSLSEIINYIDARLAGEALVDLCNRGEAVRCSDTPAEK